MGMFSKKKKEEPVEVEATIKRKKTKSDDKGEEQPQNVVHLNNSEQYLLQVLGQLGAELDSIKTDIKELKELIESNL